MVLAVVVVAQPGQSAVVASRYVCGLIKRHLLFRSKDEVINLAGRLGIAV